MNLKKISIDNFKCFGSQVDIDFGRLTLLTGANSSGKTSVIYAILGALQSGEFPFQFSTNGKYVNMGSFKDIVHNHKRKEKIRLDFTFEGNPIEEIKTLWVGDIKNSLPKLYDLNVISDKFSLSANLVDNMYLFNFTYDPKKYDYWKNIYNNALYDLHMSDLNEDEEGFDNKMKQLNLILEPQSIKNLEIDKIPIIISDTKTHHSYALKDAIDSITDIFVWFDEQINFIGPFRLSNEKINYEQSKTRLKVNTTGEGYLDQIIYWETDKDPKLKQLVTNLKKLKLLHSIKTKRVGGGKYEILVKVKKDGIETSLSDVGAGVSQFLPILVADLQLPDGSTLFIAEPESHLHPSAQSSFGDYLTNQIKTTSKNYVIEAHSEYLLNKIRLAIVKGDLKEEDVSVLFLDNDGDNNVIHKISFTPKGRIINAPKNFFKTYMIDVMDIAINASE